VNVKLLEEYIQACQKEMSYVGGDGAIEDSLWSKIKRLQKELKRSGIEFPEYESIECTKEDWV